MWSRKGYQLLRDAFNDERVLIYDSEMIAFYQTRAEAQCALIVFRQQGFEHAKLLSVVLTLLTTHSLGWECRDDSGVLAVRIGFRAARSREDLLPPPRLRARSIAVSIAGAMTIGSTLSIWTPSAAPSSSRESFPTLAVP
jgi:hypothetical protein